MLADHFPDKKAFLLDSGVGNLGSWKSFLDSLSLDWRKGKTLQTVEPEEWLIVPGVGSAGQVLETMKEKGQIEELRERAIIGQKMLAVCLGAQLFLEYNDEAGMSGLGVVSGSVSKLSGWPQFNIGWSEVEGLEDIGITSWDDSSERPSFYFNHGYGMNISDPDAKLVRSVGRGIVAIYQKVNLWGLQFHPEKSRVAGLKIVKEILES